MHLYRPAISRPWFVLLILTFIAVAAVSAIATPAHAADFDCSTATDVPQTECEALVDLYNAMDGPNWLDASQWLDSTAVCSWYGVWCIAGTNVTSLDLSYNNLNGPLPASIGDLTELTGLSVDGLSGALPTEIQTLTDLQWLTVGGTFENTQFTGPLPDLSTLTGLTGLSIENSTISGPIPSWINPTDLPNLTSLSLWRNQFSGSVPAGVTDLPATYINLVSNALTGDFPDFSGACGTLDMLFLSYNNFTAGPVPAWLNGTTCPNIQSLELRRIGRTGAFPDLSGMPLFNLALAENHFDSGPVPAWLLDLSGISSLDLSNTRRTGGVPEFTNTGLIGTLSLYSNDFSGIIPSSYNPTNYPSLYDISFYDNQITGIADEYGAFDAEEVYTSVYYNNIVPSSLHPDVLTYLDEADGSGVPSFNWKTTQNVPPTSFTLTPSGTTVDISITNDVPMATGFTVSYSVLASTTPGGPYEQDLALINEFDTPTVTGQATGLDPDTTYYVVVRSNVGTFFGSPTHGIIRGSVYSAEQSFTTGAASSATDCTDTSSTGIPQNECEALVDMFDDNGGESWTDSTNWLTGSPCTWAGITCAGGHVTAVELSENNLTGALPNLNALGNLQTLNLAGNGLTGSFPGWLASRTSITSIRLQDNDLSGTIPSLAALTNLTDLWLANNDFSGSFPAGLGNKMALLRIILDDNGFSGAIPDLSGSTALFVLQVANNDFSGALPALPPSMVFVDAGANSLSGQIPASYGSLTNLTGLAVNGNDLEGEIPAGIGDLPNLGVGIILTKVGFSHNRLTTADDDVIALLTQKNPGFFGSQTVAPTGVSATTTGDNTVNVSWTPIAYTGDSGYYQVGFRVGTSGAFTFNPTNRTADKAAASLTVSGLLPATEYCFVVSTITDAHESNKNTLTSGETAAVCDTTTGTTPAAPTKPVLTAPGDTVSLSGTVSPTLVWAPNPAEEGVTSYKLTVKNDATGASAFKQTFAAGDICDTACEVDLSPTMLANGTYVWFVTATNDLGNAKSSKSRFTLAKPDRPVAAAPTGGTTLNTVNPLLLFSIPDQAITSVKVVVKDTKSGAAVFTQVSDVAAICAGLNCTVNVTTALGAGSYEWTAKATNVNGKKASTAAAFKIVFPDKATNLMPAGNAIVPTQTPVLSWDEVANATEYKVSITSAKGNKVAVGWMAPGADGLTCAAGTCTLDLSQVPSAPVLKKGKHTWFVQARNVGLHPTSKSKSAKEVFKVKLP